MIALIIGGFYIGQSNSAKTTSISGILSENISANQSYMKELKSEHKEIPKWLINETNTMQKSQKAFSSHNWAEAAKYRINILDRDLAYAKKNRVDYSQDAGLIYVKREKKILKFVQNHNVYPDMIGRGLSGLGLVFDSLTSLFPELFVAIMIFMLSGKFTVKYQHNKNMDQLFPISNKRLDNSKLIATFLAGLVIYLMIIFISLVIGTLTHGFGSMQYPVAIEYLTKVKISPIWIILCQGIILQILGILAFLLLAQVISFIFKNKIITIMLTLLLTFLQTISPIFFPVVHPIVHLLPGVYLLGGFVANLHVAFMTHNYSANFTQGCIVSIIYILILLSIRTMQNRISQRL
jgi:ABC-2 type transport system permease protein